MIMKNDEADILDTWELAVLMSMEPNRWYSIKDLNDDTDGNKLCSGLGRLCSMGYVVQKGNEYILTADGERMLRMDRSRR